MDRLAAGTGVALAVPAPVRRTAHAGVVAALVYAALKAAWGLGSTVGITDPAAFERFEAGFGAWSWAATWGTVLLAFVAVALLLALVEPWGRRLRRRPLRIAAWCGAVVLAVAGVPALGESLLSVAGVVDAHDNGLAEWVFVVVYGAFSVLSVALASSAWHSRERGRGGQGDRWADRDLAK